MPIPASNAAQPSSILPHWPDSAKPESRRRTTDAILGQENAARAEAADVKRRTALNPDSPMGSPALAYVMNNLAELAQAFVAVEKAMRLDPGDRYRY